ncbi:MAG: Xaa-Pro peptidase family protein [Anaerolineae bacterium]|nr:Xaa-Pro peptidase family protein [Anaerolineae bacterium]
MTIDYQARLQKILDTVAADAVAFVPGANMLYFTGLHLHLSERPTIALLTRQGLFFIMPYLEMLKLEQRPDLAAQGFAWSDTDGYAGAFQQAAALLRGQRLAVDGMTMRVFEWLALAQAGVDVSQAVDAGQALLGIRAIKTPQEIAWLKRANEIAESALAATLARVQPGMTERQIATVLNDALNAAGSEGPAFGTIVLTGPKSALPHGSPDERVLGADEFLLIDFGALHHDYPSDITRTFCLGTPSAEMRRIYEAVYRANAAARAIARPGITCGAVDAAARHEIIAAGYGDYFTHRTGHGLGLSGHELPQVAAGVETVLQPGMVFTIEPGIYLPHLGGVRIEDDMVVTETGCESLTTFRREL